MNFLEICIKRPIFTTVLSLILILFGIVSYFRLSVSELPKVEFPIVSITTLLPGANAEIIDETVTDLIEAEMNTIEGVKHISSKSFEGFSLVKVEFKGDRQIDQAAQDCRDAVARIRQSLPNDIEAPVVEKLDINAFPIMWVAINDERLSETELSRIADKVIKERLQKVEGVGSITLGGEKKFALRVWLHPDRLVAHNLTVFEVMNALREKNIELPAGRIEGLSREFSIKTNGELSSRNELENLILVKRGSTSVRLVDVATIEEGVENERGLARYSMKNTVGLGIIKKPSANTIDVAKAIKKELKKIQGQGIDIVIAFDSSEFIQKSIDEVKETLWSATLLVILCIFVFLRNFRSTLIPALAIPISIISTFAVMHFLGFTLNNFTLLALVLAIGVVIDDAIVMLENIFRHIEEGKPRLEAAIQGANEMKLPIISASLALIAVFIPIAFMQGNVGQFFSEFGITVAIAIAISAFVSLTLTPMLSSRFLKENKHSHSRLFLFVESLYTRLENGYKKLLAQALAKKYWVIFFAFVTIFMSVFIMKKIGKEFVPDEDRGSFIISLEAPTGSTLTYTDNYLKQIEAVLDKNPHVEGFFAALALQSAEVSAVNKGLLFVRLTKDPKRPHLSSLMQDLRRELDQVVGVNAWTMTFNPFSMGTQSKPFQYILANQDYDELKKHIDPFVDRLAQIPGFRDVSSELEDNRAQLELMLDREKLSDLGISIQQISATLNALLTGKEATKFKKDGERYSVIVQLPKALTRTPNILNSIVLRSATGELVRLDNVVQFKEAVGSSAINRRDRRKVVTIGANLDGITLQEALDHANALFEEMLPQSFTHLVSGNAEEMMEAFASFFISLILAVAIIFLILSAQFESFFYPVIIMFALPLALIGALGTLYFAGMTLNIYSLIGMILLMGLVTKNSILLVDCTNHLLREGLEMREALLEAGRMRLRPILMTATSTILGVVPIAFSFGAGTESRRPLGVCVIGGMFSSTLLTLVVIPALYLILDSLVQKMRHLKLKITLRTPAHSTADLLGKGIQE